MVLLIPGKPVLHRSKGRDELSADARGGGNDHGRYQRGDEPILDCGRSNLVAKVRPEAASSPARITGLLHGVFSLLQPIISWQVISKPVSLPLIGMRNCFVFLACTHNGSICVILNRSSSSRETVVLSCEKHSM